MRAGRRKVLHKPLKSIEIMDEAALTVVWRGAAKVRMGIEDRQQGKVDAGARRGGNDALGHFGTVGVRRAIDCVVQIVEFGD